MGWRAFLFALIFLSASLVACPICNTETGIAVRAGIENHFGFNFLAAMSPFAAIVTVILLVTGGPREIWGERDVSKRK